MDYNKPYILRDSYSTYKHMVDYKTEERKTDPIIFMQGHALPFDTGNPNLACTKDDPKGYDLVFHAEVEEAVFTKYDCLPNNKYAPLVNARVLEILQELCPHDIQAFPATIVSEVPEKFAFENHDYWVVNITKTVDGIDKELSDFDKFESGRIKDIHKLILRDVQCMGSSHIVRQHDYHVEILVSPTLVKAFKKAKIKGVKFLKDTEC